MLVAVNALLVRISVDDVGGCSGDWRRSLSEGATDDTATERENQGNGSGRGGTRGD